MRSSWLNGCSHRLEELFHFTGRLGKAPASGPGTSSSSGPPPVDGVSIKGRSDSASSAFQVPHHRSCAPSPSLLRSALSFYYLLIPPRTHRPAASPSPSLSNLVAEMRHGLLLGFINFLTSVIVLGERPLRACSSLSWRQMWMARIGVTGRWDKAEGAGSLMPATCSGWLVWRMTVSYVFFGFFFSFMDTTFLSLLQISCNEARDIAEMEANTREIGFQVTRQRIPENSTVSSEDPLLFEIGTEDAEVGRISGLRMFPRAEWRKSGERCRPPSPSPLDTMHIHLFLFIL